MVFQPLDLASECSQIPTAGHLTGCSTFAHVYLNLLVTLYGGSQDERIQKELSKYKSLCGDNTSEHESKNERNIEQYDFIVVGAGAAGCVVANRLTEVAQWKVLLLEAGPEQPDVTLIPGISTSLVSSNLDWQYTTEPNGKSCLARPNERCSWPRGKTMGGSSTINSMAVIRGNPIDYDGWAKLGNDGWSFKDVLPFFKKSEKNLNIENMDRKYHGVDGPQPTARYPYIDDPSIMLTDAYVEAGVPLRDYNAGEQVGAMQAQAFQQNGHRVSTNQAYIQNERYLRPNLVVRPNSEVTKVLIDRNNIAYGVKYEKNGKVFQALATKEVIISGGAINSPKLLMLSGVGPKRHLEEMNISVKKDLAVGENLHDHVTFNGLAIRLPNTTATLVSHAAILKDVTDYNNADIKSGPLAANGPGNSIAFIKTDDDLEAPDIQFQVDHCIIDEYINDPSNYERVPILPKAYYTGIMPRPMNLIPKSRGVLLLNKTNPNGAPLLYPNYLDNADDFIPLIKGAKFLYSLENTEAFKSRGARYDRTPLEACKHHAWGSDEYIVCLAKSYTSSTYHPVGTCKMGPSSDKKAVVDSRLRVFGIPGLRVIDASIMPYVIRGNTNAPSIMIGERGVAFVKEEWLMKSSCAIDTTGIIKKSSIV